MPLAIVVTCDRVPDTQPEGYFAMRLTPDDSSKFLDYLERAMRW
jgi:hypothetical protein